MSAWTWDILEQSSKILLTSDCTVAEINQYNNNTVVKLRGCERDPAQKVPHWNCVRPRCERVSALWWCQPFLCEREIKDKERPAAVTSCLSGWLLWVRRARSPLRSPPRATAQCFSLPSQPSFQRSPASNFATLKITCCAGCDATTTPCSRPFHRRLPQRSQAALQAPGEATLTSATCPPQLWKSPRRSVRHCCPLCIDNKMCGFFSTQVGEVSLNATASEAALKRKSENEPGGFARTKNQVRLRSCQSQIL